MRSRSEAAAFHWRSSPLRDCCDVRFFVWWQSRSSSVMKNDFGCGLAFGTAKVNFAISELAVNAQYP